MTTLIYMPYFKSQNRGVIEAQELPLQFALTLKYRGANIEISYNEGARTEDRIPYLKKIWSTSTIVMIESTKAPSMKQLEGLMICSHDLCSQNYLTNCMLNTGEVFKFPAHKQLSDHEITDLHEGCELGTPFKDAYLRYAAPDEDFCDVSDLGIIKISQNWQRQNPLNVSEDDLGFRYNDVERLHTLIFRSKTKWHRHKELAYRSPLFHVKNLNHESEYLTEQEMRSYLHLPSA